MNVVLLTSVSAFTDVSEALDRLTNVATVRSHFREELAAQYAKSAALEQQVANVQQRLTDAEQTGQVLRSKLNLEKERVASLLLDRDRLRAMIDASETEQTGLQKRVGDLKLQLNSARSEIEEVEQQLLAKEYVRFGGKLVKVGKAVSMTARGVSDKLAIGASRNVAATYGEALPFYGIAIIIAATTWELYDSCLIMKQLAALDSAFNPESAVDPNSVCAITLPTRAEIRDMVVNSPSKIEAMMESLFPDAVPIEGPE